MIDANKTWNIGTRPTEEGCYWTVLLFDDYDEDGPTGTKCAMVALRYFGDRAENEGWIMEGEPEDASLVWTEETGSALGEQVYAWAPFDAISLPELPENVDIVLSV